jgi:hypothetical protein
VFLARTDHVGHRLLQGMLFVENGGELFRVSLDSLFILVTIFLRYSISGIMVTYLKFNKNLIVILFGSFISWYDTLF